MFRENKSIRLKRIETRKFNTERRKYIKAKVGLFIVGIFVVSLSIVTFLWAFDVIEGGKGKSGHYAYKRGTHVFGHHYKSNKRIKIESMIYGGFVATIISIAGLSLLFVSFTLPGPRRKAGNNNRVHRAIAEINRENDR
ncbi:MAG: hypothetical protein KAT43_06205 [Nanoarchaeota archaeon]|nr:hypothetical protein [Nanoarchaeota archaeon]